MKCKPQDIIKGGELKERVHYRNGDTADIIDVILQTDAISDKYIDQEAVECLRSADDYDTLHNVWKFVKHNVTYKQDRRGVEIIKAPHALFRIGRGDCKSFSISEVALLRALGFKGIRYRFTSYEVGGDFTHVYVVVKYRGRDVILDAVYPRFDEEDNRYVRKKDIPAAQKAISGIGKPASAPRNTFFKLAAIGLIVWAIFKK